MRSFLAVVAGIVVAVAAIFIVELVAHAVYPLPAEVDPNDLEAAGELIRAMPIGAQLFVAAAWFAGALIGGGAAALIARRRWPAWVVAGAVAVASILNILLIPHPELMQVAAVIAPALGGLLAGHFAVREPRPAGPAPEARDG